MHLIDSEYFMGIGELLGKCRQGAQAKPLSHCQLLAADLGPDKARLSFSVQATSVLCVNRAQYSGDSSLQIG